MGAAPEVLVAEVEAYNAAAAEGRDAHGKTVFPTTIDPQAAVHVARITPVVHYTMVRSKRQWVAAWRLFGRPACCLGWYSCWVGG